MTVAWITGFLLLIPATWIASVALAVRLIGRSSLRARVAGTVREERAERFLQRSDDAHLALSLVRTSLRIVIAACFVVAIAAEPIAAGALATGVDGAATGPAGAEPAAAAPLAGWLLDPKAAILGLAVAIVILWTTTVVIATSIARAAGESIVASSLFTISLVSLLVVPVLPLVRGVQRTVTRLTFTDPLDADEVAEAELMRSIEQQQEEGGLDAHSAAMLENVVQFNQTDVGEVMTPRTDIDGIEFTDDLAVIRQVIDEHGHSRMPVYEGNLDHLLGVLYVKDLVTYLGQDGTGFRLKPLLRQPIVVPESKMVSELLQDFQRSEVHMAIVVDEYGGTAGIVTIEDVLEEIVGEIQDEHDTDAEDLPRLDHVSDRCVEVDGRYHLDDLNEALGLGLPEEEEYDTVAGHVLARLGRVPATNETMLDGSLRFTILEATATAIDRLRIETGIDEEGVLGDDDVTAEGGRPATADDAAASDGAAADANTTVGAAGGATTGGAATGGAATGGAATGGEPSGGGATAPA